MADISAAKKTVHVEEKQAVSFLSGFVNEILYNPMNLVLVLVIAFLVYKIIKDRLDLYKANREVPASAAQNQAAKSELPRLKRDFTVSELREFDGTKGDGRILVAVNGSVFDVTKGRHMYGPDGPYASFAGRDASRNLATFSVTFNNNDKYDDLSDLNGVEMESVREWEMQFRERYYCVGKLLRDKEKPTNYEEEEEDTDRETKANETEPAAEEAAITDTEDNTVRKRNTSSPQANAR